MRTCVLLASSALTLAACTRSHMRTVSAAGVTIDTMSEKLSHMRGGELDAWVDLGPPQGDLPRGDQRLALAGAMGRGPVRIDPFDGATALTSRLSSPMLRDEHATLVSELTTGGELTATLDAEHSAITHRLVLGGDHDARLVAILAAHGADLLLDRDAPIASTTPLPPSPTRYVIIDGPTPLLIASPDGLLVQVADGNVTARTAPKREGVPKGEATITVALTRSLRSAATLGATLSASTPRKTIDVALETFDDATQTALPSRVWIEPTPRDPKAPPIVWDPSRGAEPQTPIVDVTAGRAVVQLPAGHYRMRATHGIGWSIDDQTIDVEEGDARRVAFNLRHEAPLDGWVGCDFHVHAQGSFDARAVTYEDRVRSLAAVGVDCAAATEHNVVGDYGPATRTLALGDRFTGIAGVELTTTHPMFGHFNVFPWPGDAAIPATDATTPSALFAAVHALPAPLDFVFQVNHPRIKMGDGSSIGYLARCGYDAKTGVGAGEVPYRTDYDTIELFNGYQLQDLAAVHALIDEWLVMLDRGEDHVATGDSDSHWISYPWAGFPRTYVQASRDVASIIHALKHGRAIVTSGPIVTMTIGAASIGDTTRGGQSAHIDVQLTSWLASPKLTMRLGVDAIEGAALQPDAAHAGHFTADVAVPMTTKPRPLVAIVDAAVAPAATGMTGMLASLAFTNPIWIAPVAPEPHAKAP